jgi:hypothetical protein
MNMLIGLTGPAGSGKSFCAQYLQEQFRYERVSFAGPLKAMLRAALDYADLIPVYVEAIIGGELKETPNNLLGGKTPRYAMQTLGTEWGRECLSQDFWIALAESRIRGLLMQGVPVVVDDVRFDNEADMIQRLGGTVLRVAGRSKGVSPDHPSEQGAWYHHTIDNSPGRDVRAQLCAAHDIQKMEAFS